MIKPSSPGWDICNIANPDSIWLRNLKIPVQQIRCNGMGMPGVCGAFVCEFACGLDVQLPQYRYRQTFSQVIRNLILYWMMMIVPWSAIADLITILVRRWTGSASVSNRCYQLWLPALCLPSLIYLGCTLYEAFQSTLTSREAWKRFCELMHFSTRELCWFAVPYLILLLLGCWNVVNRIRHRARKKTGPAAIIGFEATPSARQEGLCVWGTTIALGFPLACV